MADAVEPPPAPESQAAAASVSSEAEAKDGEDVLAPVVLETEDQGKAGGGVSRDNASAPPTSLDSSGSGNGQDEEVDVNRSRPGSPLIPRIVHLSSDADEEVTSWYASTFSDELSEVKRSIKKASDQRRQSLRSSLGSSVAGCAGTDHESADGIGGVLTSHSSVGGELAQETDSVSDSIATKFEIALMQANQEAESAARDKELLETRMACLEEMEELRMQLSTFELQELLEVAARDQQLAASRASQNALDSRPPFWDRDQDHSNCWRCNTPFSLTNRRHHCRRCGHIFDEACAPKGNAAALPQLGYRQPVRQCLDCLPLPGSLGALRLAAANQNGGADAEDWRHGSPPSSKAESYRISSANKRPFSGAIDAIRRLESNCLKSPSAENLIATLEAYVGAIEKISNAEYLLDSHFRKEAHATLLRAMHAFIQMPQMQGCLQNGTSSKQAHKVISAVLAEASVEKEH